MSNNWYLVNMNGSRQVSFILKEVLSKEIPFSPSLFILGAYVLSRLLNNMNDHYLYQGFNKEKTGNQVNHLSFADDVIIFKSTTKHYLQPIMKMVLTYKETLE